jgi:hypothetical protein
MMQKRPELEYDAGASNARETGAGAIASILIGLPYRRLRSDKDGHAAQGRRQAKDRGRSVRILERIKHR